MSAPIQCRSPIGEARMCCGDGLLSHSSGRFSAVRQEPFFSSGLSQICIHVRSDILGITRVLQIQAATILVFRFVLLPVVFPF